MYRQKQNYTKVVARLQRADNIPGVAVLLISDTCVISQLVKELKDIDK